MRHMKQVFKIQGEGMTLSYLGPQNTLPTIDISLSFSGEKEKTRWCQRLKKKAQKQVKIYVQQKLNKDAQT